MTNRLHTKTTKTILVVEDEELVRLGIVTPLRRAGYRIFSAADGIEGAMLFARNFDTIDLLVTDATMPGMDGTDLARFARRIRSDLKIIFATASATLNLHPVPTRRNTQNGPFFP